MTQKPREIPITERLAKMSEADRQAWVQAHPSYEAVKEANPHREPSVHEILEHADSVAAADQPKAVHIAKRLDDLLERLHHQVKQNAPIGPALVKEIEDIRALIG